MNVHTFTAPLLYYVTTGTVIVLFCSVITTVVVTLVKLGWLIMRWLGVGRGNQAPRRSPAVGADPKIREQWTPADPRR